MDSSSQGLQEIRIFSTPNEKILIFVSFFISSCLTVYRYGSDGRLERGGNIFIVSIALASSICLVILLILTAFFGMKGLISIDTFSSILFVLTPALILGPLQVIESGLLTRYMKFLKSTYRGYGTFKIISIEGNCSRVQKVQF